MAPKWMTQSGSGSKDMQRDATGTDKVRFWLEKGKSREVVFLSSGDPGTVPLWWEHSILLHGKWQTVTCWTGDSQQCPVCEAAMRMQGGDKFKRRQSKGYTILDLTKFTDGKGNERTWAVKLLAVPGKISELLGNRYDTQQESGRTLKYAKFKVTRSDSSTSARVGDDWEYKSHVDPSSIPEAAMEFDYETKLAPSMPYLRMVAGMMLGVSSIPNSDAPQEQVPF